jgi:hypothetical protein
MPELSQCNVVLMFIILLDLTNYKSLEWAIKVLIWAAVCHLPFFLKRSYQDKVKICCSFF